MVAILNISIVNQWKDLKDKRSIPRTKNYGYSSFKWPRLYGTGIWSIMDKNWELRNYGPSVASEMPPQASRKPAGAFK